MSEKIHVGIVGSRTFPQLDLVEKFVGQLPLEVVVVSGGARGVDSAAASAARSRGMEVIEYHPDLAGCHNIKERNQRFFDRNQLIVDKVACLIAFTEKHIGGTWDTIKRARQAGKRVDIIGADGRSMDEFPAGDPVPAHEPQSEKGVRGKGKGKSKGNMRVVGVSRAENKGKGPFAIKRVSLGSYALRRKCYVPDDEWETIVHQKKEDPQQLADTIAQAMIAFFREHKNFGGVYGVTVPPRSVRNLDRPHVMDLAAVQVADSIGCLFLPMFEPWHKSTRGRYAVHGDIVFVRDLDLTACRGRAIWVLDDVTTTNFTLRLAVDSLLDAGVNARGLAYVMIA